MTSGTLEYSLRLDIDESANIPSGGFIKNEVETSSEIRLPNYEIFTNKISPPSALLTLTDCHFAIRAILHKARLFIFELARQNRSFRERHLSKVSLVGPIRGLDRLLSSASGGLDHLLDIKFYVMDSGCMSSFMKNALVANESFKHSSSTSDHYT